MLFILVADVLQQFIANAMHLFSREVILLPKTLQFADDTVAIMEAHPRNLRVFSSILKFYAALTSLNINNNKSSFLSVALRRDLIPVVQTLLNCQHKDMPITYLGLPLTIRKPKKVHFQPLLLAIQKKLQGWKANFLSLAGRLTLVKSVLTTMPLHLMQVLKLPQWLIDNIDKTRRAFLWKGKDKCLGGHCLVNWAKCCLPKRNGGLGIHDLKIHNEALLTKWVWWLLTKPNSIWSSTILQLFGTTNLNELIQHPFISNQLLDILKTSKILLPAITHLSDGSVRWNWSEDGSYSVGKAYGRMMHPGVISAYASRLWKLKVPPKVKCFLWLLLQDRLLTQANLQTRGWPAIPSCSLCTTQLTEDVCHLFKDCHFASNIWQIVIIQYNLGINFNYADMLDFWLLNRGSLTRQDRSRWDRVWSATCWAIWKHRCRIIFQEDTPVLHKVLWEIELLVTTWSKALFDPG